MPVSAWIGAGNGAAGIDQGGPLPGEREAAHFQHRDLGDAVGGRVRPRRLDVDNGERRVQQAHLAAR